MGIEQDKIDLTCTLRAAAEMGMHEGVCNHFSYAVDSETFLINPQGIHWLELVPSDIVTVDAKGNRIAGNRAVEPTAFFIHSRVHRAKLIVAKLDRLARNLGFLTTLMNDGVEFTCCDVPQANKLTIHILAAVAEAEAEAISQRTKVALEAAKARGVALGGHREGAFPGNSAVEGRKRGTEVLQKQAAKRRADLMPIIEGIKASGITTIRGIADELNSRNIPTPRGSRWSATQILRLVR